MKGIQCGFDYCWICLVPYDLVRYQGSTAHARACHQWKDEDPAQYKARKAAERKQKKEAKLMKDEQGQSGGGEIGISSVVPFLRIFEDRVFFRSVIISLLVD